MARSNLDKRVTVLEQTTVPQQKMKVICYSKADFREKLLEIEQAEADGYRAIAVAWVAPGDLEENSDWGEHLRKEKGSEEST